MNRIILIIGVVALLAVSCSNSKKREKAISEINELTQAFEKSIAGSNFDLNKAHQLAELYNNFMTAYPKDSVVPEMMIKLAILQASYLGETDAAVENLKSISAKFPESEQAPQALFLAGDYYQYKLQELDKARECYQKMIDEYPKDPLTAQARILLQNLGKSPEELLDIILDKRAEEEAAAIKK